MKYFLLPRPHNLWSKYTSCAFTLIELTITLALIVCLVSISFPVILNTSRLYVANQARNLQATCWALEQQAIAQNKQIELYLNQAANFYVWAEQVVKLAPKVKFGVIDGVLGPPSSPQKEIQRAVTFAENKIIFYPDGRISPGSVYLVDDMNRILYAVTVSVASVSYVRLYRYVNNHWHQFT